jgi:hypothetical protein
VCGLEVVAAGGHRVAVAPGIGVDSDGHTLILSEPVYFTVNEKGQTFITLSFLRTADRDSAVAVGEGVQYFRLVEGARPDLNRRSCRAIPHLELARIYRTGAQVEVKNARESQDPDANEINLLHRAHAFPFCHVDLSVGELPYVPLDDPRAWKPNRGGLLHLLREGNAAGFHLRFHGPLNLRAVPPSPPALLYVAGEGAFAPLSEAEVDGLSEYLADGGTLLAEAPPGGDGFAQSFSALVARLGAKLKPVEFPHPLLESHHAFDAPPPGGGDSARKGGSDSGDLQCDAAMGVIWSRHDYGAAWRGVVHEGGRERVRTATEFGLNIIAFAQTRSRRAELSRLLEGV